MTRKKKSRAPERAGKPLETEKIVFIALSVLVVVGTLIFYRMNREEGRTGDVHNFASMSDDPALTSMLQRFQADPQDLETVIGLGNYYYDHSDFPMAEMFYKKALEIDPHDVDVMVDLGTVLFFMQREEEALRAYQNALEIDPKHKNALFNMGVMKQAQGDREGAVEWWRKFVEVAGDDPHAEPIRKMIAEMEREKTEGGTVE